MDDVLYDTSWALYYFSNASPAFRDLALAEQRMLSHRANQMQSFLTRHKSAYDDDESTMGTIGGLRECSWRLVHDPRRNTRPWPAHPNILVQIKYEKATYKCIIYGGSTYRQYEDDYRPLLLMKSSANLAKVIGRYFSETLDTAMHHLKPPSSLVQTSLESYIDLIHRHAQRDASSPIVNATLTSLKITLAFALPVAPKLKSMEIDIPRDTIGKLVTTSTPEPPSGSPPGTFFSALTTHIRVITGLKLLTSQETSKREYGMRISKISCAAFAISADGRLKFSSKAPDGAVQHEDVVRDANEHILTLLVAEARRQCHG